MDGMAPTHVLEARRDAELREGLATRSDLGAQGGRVSTSRRIPAAATCIPEATSGPSLGA